MFLIFGSKGRGVFSVERMGARLAREESEVKRAGFTLVESMEIDVPGVKEAKVRLECELETAIELGGDGEYPGCDLIIAKVKYYHIEESIYEDGRFNCR